MEAIKVCKDCPLYTARHLFNASRSISLKQGETLASHQDFIPSSIAAGPQPTFPKVEITVPPDVSADDVTHAVEACNHATANMSGIEHVARLARNVINISRHTDCPAFEALVEQSADLY
jgi:hypothetical protein